MKTFLILLLVVTIQSHAVSQKFTVSELVTLYNNDNSFFDTFVLQKGYNFSDANKNVIFYVYKNDQWNFNSINIVYRKEPLDTLKQERCISWTFTSDTSYLRLKNELANNGYKLFDEYTNKDDYSSTNTFMYENGEYKMQVVPQKLSIYKKVVYNVLIMKQ
jgi:hypothetical protein